MGLFSTKKKHYVDTSVVRVVEDTLVPDAITTALVESVFNKTPIVTGIQNAVLNGSFRNFEKMYRYAEKDEYFYGLPDQRVISSGDGKYLVKEAIEEDLSIADLGIELEYSHFRPPNHSHMGWKYITERMEYDHATNELVKLSREFTKEALARQELIQTPEGEEPPEPANIRVFLTLVLGRYNVVLDAEPEASSLGQWSANPVAGLPNEVSLENKLGESLSGTAWQQQDIYGYEEEDAVEIYFAWLDELGETHEDKLTLGINSSELRWRPGVDWDDGNEYYQAKYSWKETVSVVDDDGFTTQQEKTRYGYWTFDPLAYDSAEKFPDLVNNFNAESNYKWPGTYFPFAIFRREKDERNDDKNRTAPEYHDTEEYKTTKKLLGYIGLDFQEMGDQIHENPDIKDIDQAVLLMAVPITSQNQVELDYLYRYFTRLYENIPYDGRGDLGLFPPSHIASLDTQSDSYAVEITDADFKVTISLQNISKRLRAGNLGTLEDPEAETVKIGTFTNEFIEPTTSDWQLPGLELPDIGVDPEARWIPIAKTRILRKQITEVVYEEIRITDPKIRYDIYKEKGVEGGADDDRLLIPLDREICREMRAMDLETLYYRSLNFVFNSHVVEKTKWYQKKAFKALLVIVTVVIIVYSGVAFGKEIYGAWTAALTGGAALTGAAWAAFQVIALGFIKSLAFQFALGEVVDLVGPEIAFVIAAIAIVVGFNDGEPISTSLGEVTAADLLLAGNGLISAIETEFAEMTESLAEDFTKFSEMTETKWEELEEAQALLNTTSLIDPMAFIGMEPSFIPGEGPGAYFDRLNHTGNPAVMSLNIVENFVDISIRLPELNETLGDKFYGRP